MIRFYDVTKVYPNGTEALKTVRFRVPEKKFTFLTGPSGSGKTTIIKIVLCIEAATSGSVIVGGRNLAAVRRPTVPYLRRNIGVIWQDFKLLDSRTVFERPASCTFTSSFAARRSVASGAWSARISSGLR